MVSIERFYRYISTVTDSKCSILGFSSGTTYFIGRVTESRHQSGCGAEVDVKYKVVLGSYVTRQSLDQSSVQN